MSILSRNSSSSFSRRYRYEPLGLHGRETMVRSFSYRRRRAKQRKVFLTTYKLSSIESLQKPKSRKLKKAVLKVKKIVATVLIFMGISSFRSSISKPAISTASPGRNRKRF